MRVFVPFICTVLLAFPSPAVRAAGQEPPTRVGVTGLPLELSLRGAVELALERNSELIVVRETVVEEERGLQANRGVFDPTIQVELGVQDETLPVGSFLAGGPAGSVANRAAVGGVRVQQRLPYGAQLSAGLESQRTTTSNLFTQLNPQFPSSLNVGITFPLLRDRATDEDRREIAIAGVNVERAEADLRRVALDVVTRVRTAYWDLAFARGDVDVRAEAVRLAQEQVERNRRLLGAGEVAEIAVIEAEAELQRRREELFTGYENVTAAENALKALIAGDADADVWLRELRPTDEAEQGAWTFDPAAAWNLARDLRPELALHDAREREQEIRTAFFADQTRPSVDLALTYRSAGLAGRERTEGNPFGNDALQQRVNELSAQAGLAPLPPAGAGGLPERLTGGPGQSFRNLFGADFRTFQLGVQFELPFGNNRAQGDLGRSLAAERRLRSDRNVMEQQILAQVRNALQRLETAGRRVEAALAARDASQAKLDSEIRLFEAGETTNFLVLTRQNEYSASAGRLLRARTDFNLAIAGLQGALGSALDVFAVRVRP